MTIIDAHIHFHDSEGFHSLAKEAGHENTVAHLTAEYKRLGFAGAVVMGNRSLEPAAHDYPPFMRYCVGLDSTIFIGENITASVDLVEQNLRQKNCVGIKLYAGYNPYYVSDPVYGPYLELAAHYKKPVAIHMGELAGTMGILKYAHPLTLDEVAVAHRDVEFVMCHFGNPWAADAAAVLAKNPNVSADLSGLLEGRLHMDEYFAEHAGYVAHLQTWLRYCGAWDRLMFGTDFPLANLENYVELVSRLIPSPHHQLVFAENARRIYGLDF